MPKKPQLTPEEKKRLREEKKLQMKLAKEEGKRQLKRDELSRELKYGMLTRKKLGTEWYKMLMDIKLEDLKTDMQLTINNCELIMDTKDHIISFLMDELDDAEEQYTFNFRKHCENIQNLYRIYLLRLNKLKEEYDNELTYLHYILRKQLNEIKSKDEQAIMYFKTMSFELGVQEKQLENMGRSLYMTKQNEQEARNSEESNLKRKKCEDNFEHVWRCFTQYLENYTSQISEKEKYYEERINRDGVVVKIINKQSEDLFKLINLLRVVKDRQAAQKEKLNKRLKDLSDEKDTLNNTFVTLKKILMEDQKYDEKMLTYMVVNSGEQIEKLKSTEALAEKILKYYAVIRKFETKREKILAFPKIRPRKFKMEQEWGNLKTLANFWQKCALADVARNNVNDEYMHLLEENYSLKHSVKACINYECNAKLPSINHVHKNILRASSSNIVYRL